MDFFDLTPKEIGELLSGERESASLRAYQELGVKLRPFLGGNGVRGFERQAHVAFVRQCLQPGSVYHTGSFYALQVWLCYWTVHSLHLLRALHCGGNGSDIAGGGDDDDGISSDGVEAAINREEMIETIRTCRNDREGGFAGMSGQCLAHLASSYAAVCALCTLGGREAFDVIDVPSLLTFLCSMYDAQSGSFGLYANGERDLRGTYCALVVASLCGFLPRLVDHCGLPRLLKFIAACQCPWEGGFGPVPRTEAHAGYTYCGLASLSILSELGALNDDEHRVNYSALLGYLRKRQDPRSGGLNGRTNKLVDGCYSFWVYASLRLLPGHAKEGSDGHIIDREELWRFLLNVCQLPEADDYNDEQSIVVFGDDDDFGAANEEHGRARDAPPPSGMGGFRDKPGKSADLYHTCYCLSALSLLDEDLHRCSSEWPKLHPAYNVDAQLIIRMQRHFQCHNNLH